MHFQRLMGFELQKFLAIAGSLLQNIELYKERYGSMKACISILLAHILNNRSKEK